MPVSLVKIRPPIQAQVDVLLSAFRDMRDLEKLAHLAFSDPTQAFAGLQRLGGYFPMVESVVRCMAAHTILTTGHRERDVVHLFWQGLDGFLPGAVRIQPNGLDKRHQPDGFVAWQRNELPVEIKRDVFDGNALRQLQRYMVFYDRELGVAVAPTLTATLPENITFVEVKPDGQRVIEDQLAQSSLRLRSGRRA